MTKTYRGENIEIDIKENGELLLTNLRGEEISLGVNDFLSTAQKAIDGEREAYLKWLRGASLSRQKRENER